MKKELNKDLKFVIVGSGAFGTAIANTLAKENERVTIFGVDAKEIEDLQVNRRNSKYYAKVVEKNIVATLDAKEAFADADVIVLAIPSAFFKDSIKDNILPNLTKKAYFVNLSKGLDPLTQDTLSVTIKKTVPEDMNAGVLKLSGPSFAEELMQQQPTKFVLASDRGNASKKLAPYFTTSYTSIETSNQLEGIEWLSVVKNSYALLLGIVDGLGYKTNTKSYIFQESVKEMQTFMDMKGMDKKLVLSPAGVGDLFLTSTSKKSRNYSTGLMIGKKNGVTKRILTTLATVEGVKTVELVKQQSTKEGVELELFDLLYKIIYLNEKPATVMEEYFNKRQ